MEQFFANETEVTLKAQHSQQLVKQSNKSNQARVELETFKEEAIKINLALQQTQKAFFLQLSEIQEYHRELEKITEQSKFQEELFNVASEALEEIIEWQSKLEKYQTPSPNSMTDNNKKIDP